MKAAIPMGRGLSVSDRINKRASVYSFQTRTKVKIPHEISPGLDRGRTIRIRAPNRLAPSTIAASSNASGMLRKKDLSIHMQKGKENATEENIMVTWFPISRIQMKIINKG